MRSIDKVVTMESREVDCARHGPYLSRRLFGAVWMSCPTCAAALEIEDRQRAQDEACQIRALVWARRVGEAGIPERFRDRSLESFCASTPAQHQVLRFAQEYVSGFGAARARGRSAIFVGRPGTGKTHLATAIGMALLREGRTVRYATVMRAVRQVKDSWGHAATMTESQAVRQLTAPDLLILDEIGVQTGSDFERHLLFDVLDERYASRRPSLLLSNLPLAEAGEYLGSRVLDRLREDGGEQVVFDWESYRARLADKGQG